jgi:NAD(P)H-hydrate epimerase
MSTPVNSEFGRPPDTLALSRRQSREADQIAIQEYGLPGIVLMENAGRGCAEQLLRRGCHRGVVICCGPGNNGGDGFVIARHLSNRDVPVKVVLFFASDKLKGDALVNFLVLQKMDVVIERFVSTANESLLADLMSSVSGVTAEWLVDAWLGTGAVGPVQPPLDRGITLANQLAIRRMAIDIPSGLDCDTGIPSAVTFRADVTCSFMASKLGFRVPEARSVTGEIEIIDIGLPKSILDRLSEKYPNG